MSGSVYRCKLKFGMTGSGFKPDFGCVAELLQRSKIA